MKKLTIFFINICLVQMQFCFTQSIKRSTICSVGSSRTVGEVRISSSFGQQCPGCSVLEASNGQGFIRQGFQQPLNIEGLLPNCDFDSAIAFESEEDDCGTYYNFEYMGLADLSVTEFFWDFGEFGVPQTSNEQNPSGVTFTTPVNSLVTLDILVDGVCQESALISVNALQIGFGVLATADSTTCFGEATAAIQLEFFNGVGPFSIQWADSDIVEASRTGLTAGDYPYTISDADGCVFESVATIFGPTEEITIELLSNRPESCTDTQDGRVEIAVTGGTAPYTIAWSDQTLGEILDGVKKGVYTVEIRDANGCQTSANFEVLNYCEDEDELLFDVFSPNEDGMNDLWVIPGIENFPNNKVVLHNRWGNVVWDIRGYQNVSGSAFEGRNNDGQSLPTGAYYYVIEMNDPNNIVLGGAITLVR